MQIFLFSGTEECAMEEVSGNSQGGDGFSQAVSGDSGVFTMSDTSLCPGKEGTLRSENSDPNNFSSADSSGCQTRENFIDLTDTEIDNQVCVATLDKLLNCDFNLKYTLLFCFFFLYIVSIEV